MDTSDFDELIGQAKQIGAMLGDLYEDFTGEEFDLEGTIKHYPLVALGLGLGAGVIAGWWVGRRHRAALPPPQADPTSGFGRLSDLFKLAQDSTRGDAGGTKRARDVFESFFPSGVEKVRDVLPDVVSEEAAAMAKTWVDSVLEPKLREGIDAMATNVTESKFGSFVRQTLARFDETEEHRLDDPELPPKP